MCGTCGCGQPDPVSIRKPGEGLDHEHEHTHADGHTHSHLHHHHHDHDHNHIHSHDHEHYHPHALNVDIDIMHRNNLMAERNRGFFEAKGIKAFNLVSSPGSGKTSILEQTIGLLQKSIPVFIIEGDQQTMLDADRIEKTGAPVVQVNTGSGCHLDSQMINLAVKKLEVSDHSILFIENVGNLVCPALFDLGETRRVVIISVTEGQDKPLKYPNMFQSSNLCLINKSDLLPYVEFDIEQFREYALRVNHHLQFLTVSAKTGEGMKEWIEWLSSI